MAPLSTFTSAFHLTASPAWTSHIKAPTHSTIVGCDKIFVVSQGEVAEHGTHQELVEKGGIYASMYKRQDGKEGACWRK